MARKEKPLPPRRKRMKRAARLQSARRWVPAYEGQNILEGYAKWFGVDLECAIKELHSLGVALDPDYVQQLRMALQERIRSRALRKLKASEDTEGYGAEWDDDFAYIAGFTSGGVPYGITWEEEERLATVELSEACEDDDVCQNKIEPKSSCLPVVVA